MEIFLFISWYNLNLLNVNKYFFESDDIDLIFYKLNLSSLKSYQTFCNFDVQKILKNASDVFKCLFFKIHIQNNTLKA